MTIVEASNKLFDWFSKSDYFSFADNFQEMIVISETLEEDKACLTCALEEFEKLEFVKSAQIKGKKIWVLKKAFDSFEQNVSINFEMAHSISGIINTFCETINDTSDQCDPTNITKKDIKNLLIIFHHVTKTNAEK